MAAGISQPGGAGTTIFIYDDSDTTGGRPAGPYSFAQIAAAFPADFISDASNPLGYRSKVTLQVGDGTTGTATTTLQDSDVTVKFDSTKTLQYRATQTTSWNTNFGTKVGTGNKASGRDGVSLYVGNSCTFRGSAAIYGSTIVQMANSPLSFTPAVSGSNFELVECRIGNKGTTGGSLVTIGSSAAALSNLFNVDIWGNMSSSTIGLLNTFNSANAERIGIAINGAAYFIRSSQGTLSVKDLRLFGTPVVADMVNTALAGTTIWTLVNIGWSGNAPKFGVMQTARGDVIEYRVGDMKVGDVNGNPVSGASARMTDVLPAVAFNTTTDANGRVSFGSGILTNAVPVADHYGSGGLYVTASRGPYFVEVAGLRYYAMWPTDANGNYEDMADLVPTQLAGGNPTQYIERVVPS